MRLIDADELIKYLSPVAYKNRIIKNDDFSYVMVSIMSQATIKAIPIEVLEELRSDCLRVKHNTGNIDTVIDKLDRKISEVSK